MRDQDKPFVLYRRGPMNFTIVPRGTMGWLQFGIWMALLAPPVIAFTLHADAHEGTPRFYLGLGLFLVTTLVWCLGGIWWMKARAEVVDVEELLRLKREEQRKRGRKGG